MHHEYIQRNGVDPFISRFTQLISENAALKSELERIDESRRVRKAVSLVKTGARANNMSRLDGTLPMQVELIISQRAQFLGKALDEVKVNLKGLKKPERRRHMEQRVNSLSRLNK